jgi:hypothetical protein
MVSLCVRLFTQPGKGKSCRCLGHIMNAVGPKQRKNEDNINKPPPVRQTIEHPSSIFGVSHYYPGLRPPVPMGCVAGEASGCVWGGGSALSDSSGAARGVRWTGP